MNKEHYDLTSWGLSHVTIKPDYTVLDVGCGGGKTINRLAEMAPMGKVYGIDYSPDMVTYAKKINKKLIEKNKVEIKETSVDNTGLPNNTFDLVTAVETYYFWPSLPDAFKEVHRILKLNGALLMVNEMIKDGVYEVENAALIEKVHVRLFRLEELRGMLEAAGFRVEVFRKEGTASNALVAYKSA
ncbi:MAG TPA: class I SAM-dependent methyltransferase [Oculatellaceae cyanobacterium]